MLLFFAASAALVAGCGRPARDRNTIYILTDGPASDSPHSFDPRFAGNSYDTKISRLIFSPLVNEDRASLEPVGDLASAITPVTPTIWDITLKPGQKFADGSPVTALDVYETYRSLLNTKGKKSTMQGAFAQRIAGLRLLPDENGHKIRFFLRESLATFVTDLDMGIIPAASIRKYGTELPESALFGAGPYRLESVDPAAEQITLVRNPHAASPSKVERVSFRTLVDDNARLLALVGGSADLMQGGVPPTLLGAVLKEPALKVATDHSALLTYIGFNHDDRLLRDRRVRHAIAYALDREQIIRSKFRGRAVPATGLLPPSHWAYSGDVERYEFNPEKAKRLLDEAGYPDPDGDGPQMRFQLTYKTSNVRFRTTIARVIAFQLERIGIGCEVRALEFQTLLADLKSGSFQLFSMQTSEIVEPDMAYAYYNSTRIPTPKQRDLTNRMRFRSAVVDSLTMIGRYSQDRAVRRGVYAVLQRVLSRELPVVPLWHEDNVVVTRTGVEGYRLIPNTRYAALPEVTKN